nr:uncharacterized protein LOC123003263 [Drosophila takahashii]
MWDDFQAMYTKLTVYGEQGSHWQYYSIPIDEMEEDFQVVFTPSDPKSRSGDIAIDDVKLTRGKCIAEKPKASPLPDNENGSPKIETTTSSTFTTVTPSSTKAPESPESNNGHSSKNPSDVEEPGCPEMPKPERGFIVYYNKEKAFSAAADAIKAEIICAYEVDLEGSKTTTCQNNEWSPELGTCGEKTNENEKSSENEEKSQESTTESPKPFETSTTVIEKQTKVKDPKFVQFSQFLASMAFAVLFWSLTIFILFNVAQPNENCNFDISLANGKVTETSSVFLGDNIEFECNRGYTLQGKSWHLGSGNILKRFCAKAGCRDFEKPENGFISAYGGGLRAVIECDEEFVLRGNPGTYCNGTEWIIPLGTCQKKSNPGDFSCDFEREDLCGWEASVAIPQPWQRVSAAFDFLKTKCIRQDHTFRSDVQGHFIRLQSQVHASRTSHFISPIYPRDLTLGHSLRFQFQLFMSQTGSKSLVISVKPFSMPVQDMWQSFRESSIKLIVSGDQGTNWQSHSIHIGEMETDFQVVFTVTEPSSLNGDIGIDDVEFIEQ